MTLPPRAVLVHRRTELEELIDRHGTRAQAAFFLSTRGRRIEDSDQRHRAVKSAIAAVCAVVPATGAGQLLNGMIFQDGGSTLATWWSLSARTAWSPTSRGMSTGSR